MTTERIMQIWECLRCGWKWVNRKQQKPYICPKCKSYLWNVPKEGNGAKPNNEAERGEGNDQTTQHS